VVTIGPNGSHSFDHFDHDLTIRGMLEIYRRNTAAKD